MRTILLTLFTFVLLNAADEGRFENSSFSLTIPSGVTLNDADFDYFPDVSYKFLINGTPVVIGLQNDLASNRQQLLDRAVSNISRYLDNPTSSDFSTYGSLSRCQGRKMTGVSKHPKYSGEISVYIISFVAGPKTVLLIAIDVMGDKRFAEAIGVMKNSIKLKN